MEEEQLPGSQFYQTVVAVIVIGLATLIFVLFGLEKTGKYDGDDSKRPADGVATKNSETLEVRGPFTKYV